MDPFEKIKNSLKYGTLDHKWIARDYLYQLTRSGGSAGAPDEDTIRTLYAMATSSFNYYNDHYDVFQSDTSLKSITELCSTDEHSINVDQRDDMVFHLSNVFNEIIESTRALHQCYDCGTTARAIFLKLVATHRWVSFINHQEQQRMKNEYLVKKHNVRDEIDKCHKTMREVSMNTVFIMSLAIQNFGHVWVIEKIFIDGKPRYHHYQTCLRSHLLLDFIESKDYGRNLHQSLDTERFFNNLTHILTKRDAWTDQDYYLYAEMFAYLPGTDVTKPSPGFSYTWITY